MWYRKQFFRIVVTIFFCVLASVSVYSQEATSVGAEAGVDPNTLVEVTDQALKVEVTALDQAYPSKNITFRVKVKSGVDSGRVFIQWYYPQSLYNIVGNSLDNVTLVSGSEFVGEKTFSPIIIPNEKTFTQDRIIVDVHVYLFISGKISIDIPSDSKIANEKLSGFPIVMAPKILPIFSVEGSYNTLIKFNNINKAINLNDFFTKYE